MFRGIRIGLVALLALVGLVPRVSAQSGDPPLPAPGRLVDIGGWRLHLHCTGVASPSKPAVLLEAGIGDFSVEWSLVQPGVSEFARVCSYDRADDGWSDMGPHPRTLHQIVYELHTLLERAGEKGPFVLVGHSFGGWVVRLFASTYPEDVAGMVLVDAGADDPWRMSGDGKLQRASALATGRPIPAAKTSGPVTPAGIPQAVVAQLDGVAKEMTPKANEPPRNLLPLEAQRMRTWSHTQIKHWVQSDNPFEAEELAGLRMDRTRTPYPLGNRPLIVITRGLPDGNGPDTQAREAEHRAEHQQLTAMSRRGSLVVAERSGHHIQLQQPDLVIAAIREALTP